MSDFNIDDVLSQFGSKTSSAKKKDFDVDAILKQFSGSEEPATPAKTERIYVSPAPIAPPISGVSKEASDELNRRTGEKGGADPRSWLPTTDIQNKAYEAHTAGKEMFSSGVEDLQTGHPYKGLGKAALGALSVVAAPMTGIVEGGIGTPVADITGNKEIGDRAAFVAGSALPVVPGAGAVVKAIPKNKALSTLVENIGRENLPAVVSAMKANPRLTPADLSPRVLQDTQHLFTSEGPQIEYLAKTSAERMAGRKDAIEAAYDASGGKLPQTLLEKITGLAEASKKVGSEKINPAKAGAGPVNITPAIEHIDKILKPGVMSVVSEGSTLALPEVKQALAETRKLLTNGKETRTGAEDLHSIQSSLRRQSYNLLKSPNPKDREVGNALLGVRNKIVEAIDEASPKANGAGTYKPALEGYRDEMHIADAFRKGHDDIFTSSKKIENDPSFVKKWFDDLTDSEKQAAKEGARAAIYSEMGAAKNAALAGESVARSDFNKAKMEILFGKEEATKLLDKLEAERAIANTHNKVVEGSQTAMRMASKSQFALPGKTDAVRAGLPIAIAEGANAMVGGYPIIPTLGLAAAKGVAMTKDAVKLALARNHNAQYAKYALPTEGPSRDELIRALEAQIPGPKPSLLTRGSNALSRIVAP